MAAVLIEIFKGLKADCFEHIKTPNTQSLSF